MVLAIEINEGRSRLTGENAGDAGLRSMLALRVKVCELSYL
jgi:hypothetical protein